MADMDADARSRSSRSSSRNGTAEPAGSPLPNVSASVWTKIGEGGRVVIPAEVRQALGLKSGSQVLLSVEDGELHILTTRQATRRAQKLAEPYIQPGVSVVDELIAERRAEDARDEEVTQPLGASRE
jgi:AbrB family looped-hinge helix DNA binding protein